MGTEGRKTNSAVPKRALSVRLPMTVGLAGIAVLLGGFGYWAGATTLASAVVAPGSVMVQQSRQVVQHLDGGVVAELHVREGQFVETGELLIELDDTMLQTERLIIEGELFELMARRARLEAERDNREQMLPPQLLADALEKNPATELLWAGQKQLLEARQDSLNRQIDQYHKRQEQIRLQVSGVAAQKMAQERQLELLAEESEAIESLYERGLVEITRALALRREVAAQTGRLAEIEASFAELNERVVEIDMEILRMETERREQAITELRDLQRRESELLERRRAVLDRLARLDIRAPVGGVVYDQQVFGAMAVIKPADPVLFIVPQNRPLVVSARINPVHIDQVYVGQAVSMQFAALDQRTVPPIDGHVTKVSPDVFEVPSTGETYYQAEIEITPGQLEHLEDVRIVPGMPVDSFIRTRDRSPIEYLTQPLTDYFKRALRES
jgi:HlyD family type I secretion membrane fusion protein